MWIVTHWDEKKCGLVLGCSQDKPKFFLISVKSIKTVLVVRSVDKNNNKKKWLSGLSWRFVTKHLALFKQVCSQLAWCDCKWSAKTCPTSSNMLLYLNERKKNGLKHIAMINAWTTWSIFRVILTIWKWRSPCLGPVKSVVGWHLKQFIGPIRQYVISPGLVLIFKEPRQNPLSPPLLFPSS